MRGLRGEGGSGLERRRPRLLNRCPRQLVEQHCQRSPVRDHYCNAVSVQPAAELRYSRFERFESLTKAGWHAAQVSLPSLRLVGHFGPEVSDRSPFPDTDVDLPHLRTPIYFTSLLPPYHSTIQP